jgi:hypothetical protein
MSDVPRPPPAQAVILSPPTSGGVVALGGDVVGALKTSPVLLLIVLLNMAFAGVGGYYLLQVEAYRAQERAALSSLLEKCLTQSVPTSYLQERMRQESK